LGRRLVAEGYIYRVTQGSNSYFLFFFLIVLRQSFFNNRKIVVNLINKNHTKTIEDFEDRKDAYYSFKEIFDDDDDAPSHTAKKLLASATIDDDDNNANSNSNNDNATSNGDGNDDGDESNVNAVIPYDFDSVFIVVFGYFFNNLSRSFFSFENNIVK
jgi:hypothetical protein